MRTMSGPSPFDPFGASPDGPFGEQFAELLRRFSGVAPGATWDQARQMAAAIAAEGDSEPNIDPIARMHYEELARVAELHLGAVMEVHPRIGLIRHSRTMQQQDGYQCQAHA